MKTLKEIYAAYSLGTDKGTTHSYVDVYESILAPYRSGCILMELGLAVGDCLYMWQEYLSNSKIIGVDTNDGFPKQKFPGIEIITADCTTARFLDQLGDRTFDIVIDDASHRIEDQIKSFNLLKSRMNKNGIYIIEDVQDIDAHGAILHSRHDKAEMLDLRKERDRYDNVLCIYRF